MIGPHFSNKNIPAKPTNKITSQNVKDIIRNSTLNSFKNIIESISNNYTFQTDVVKKQTLASACLETLNSAAHSLNAKDQYGLTIAYYFGIHANDDVCSFLESQGAELSHIIAGAIMANRLDFANRLIAKYKAKYDGALSIFFPAAAAFIGDAALVETYLNQYLNSRSGSINKRADRIEDIYDALADFSARGGHIRLTESLLKNITNDKFHKLFTLQAAGAAAWGGHKEIAEYFIAHSTLTPDFNIIAGYAARGGHKELAEYFLAKINLPETPNYNKMACQAIMGANIELALYFLAKITPPHPIKYNDIADCAVAWGHRKAADQLLAQILPPERPDYKRIANTADNVALKQYYHSKANAANMTTTMPFPQVASTPLATVIQSNLPVPPITTAFSHQPSISTQRSSKSILATAAVANHESPIMILIRENQRKIEQLEKRVAELESASAVVNSSVSPIKAPELIVPSIAPVSRIEQDENTCELPTAKRAKRKPK